MTMFLFVFNGKKFGRSWNNKDLPKPVGRTAITSWPFNMWSKHFTWSGFKQYGGKFPLFNAKPSRWRTFKLNYPPSCFYTRTTIIHANLLHPRFSGVRISRCQGLFPATKPKGKGPGNEVADCSQFLWNLAGALMNVWYSKLCLSFFLF